MWDFTSEVTDVLKVPEQYRNLYEKNGDKFVVKADIKPLVDAYVGTNKRMGELEGKTKEAREESIKERKLRQAFEDIAEKYGISEKTAEALGTHIDDLIAQAKGGKELKVNMEKMRADMEKKMNETLSAKDKELQGMQGALSEHLVDGVAISALSELKGNAPLLLPHVKAKCKVICDEGKYSVRILDAQGDIRGDGKGGFMTVKDLVNEMKSDQTFSSAFESTARPGGGIPPQRGGGIPPKNDLSPTQKISAGLAKGQAANR